MHQKVYNWLRFLILSLFTMVSSVTYAYDFEVDGICYNIIGIDKVEVTHRYENDKEENFFNGDINIPESVSYENYVYRVTAIGSLAFYKCVGMTGQLVIPSTITSIGFGAFYDCSGLIGSLTIPNSVKSIGAFAFWSCTGLKGTLTLGNSLETIGEDAFLFCDGLTGPLNIPNSVTTIGKEAFCYCQFTSITIPNSVTSIEDMSFCGNSSLEHVYSQIEHPFSIGQNTFYDIPTTTVLHVPQGTKSLYQKYAGWTNYFSNIVEDLENTNQQVTTYTLSITATGNGSASFDGTAIRYKTQAFTVNEGTKATITFTPDNGYQIKSLKVNNTAVTASTSYTATINSDTSIEVEFEAKPVDPDTPKTYTLSIRAKGNGIATYNGETIRATTKTYTIEEGTKVSMTFTPDEGNQIKSLRVNGEYQTITDKYEGTINADTSIKIDFEEIPVDPEDPDTPDDPDTPEPPVTYTLSIKVIGNGTATYEDEVIRDNTSTFTLDEGTTGTIAFTPDEGYHIKSLMVNGSTVSIDTSYSFTMNSDTSVEVEFEETVVISKFSVDGLNYEVNSLEDHTVTLGAGDYGLVLNVPEKVTYNDVEWTVTGIVYDALVGSEELAAVIWNPGTAFNAKVTNPNLLLYVKDEAYAPVNIKNVVVNSYASSISLTEAMSGNNFYCPLAFTAQSVEYTHNYLMKSGLNASRGWETIALPFDVQKISHSSKGEIVPFAKWTSDGSTKPFWLYELSGNGFVEADGIKANTPYIISMPNNEAYPGEYQLTGRVTFSAENVEVKKSDEVQTATYSNHTFMPSFINLGSEAGYYALNVNNDYEYYRGSENEGSKFILNLRKIHPFEAYMTSTSGTRSIDISEGMTTGIRGIEEIGSLDKVVKVYDLSGRLIKTKTTIEAIRQELPAGVYIVNNRKMIIK